MQAILIMAHRDIQQVKMLAAVLRSKFEVYIHFDQKLAVSEEDLQAFQEMGVHTFQEINVNWGGWGIAAAARLLMKEALKNPEISYLHVISGQCWPTRRVEEIYDFYENQDSIYMLCSPVKGVKKSGEPLIFWQKYYFNYDRVNRRTAFGKIYHRMTIALQTLLRVDKLKKLNIDLELYEGPNWMDLPRDAAEYLLEYFDQHENVQKLFMTGFCPDEFWVQTILYNSDFRSRIVQDYHRYIKWEHRNGSYPAVLDQTDFEDIRNGDYHFMRKVDRQYSKELIRMLEDTYQTKQWRDKYEKEKRM